MPLPSGGFGDIRTWWVVLRDALRMAPHAAARPAAGEAAIWAYATKVATLLAAAEWLSNRVQRTMVAGLTAPLERLGALARRLGIEVPPEGPAFLGLLRQPAAPEGLSPVIPAWVIAKGIEVAALCGVVMLLARLVRPRLPLRPAFGLGLAALASGTVYGLILNILIFRAEDAFGIAAALNAAVAPTGHPQPGFGAALEDMQVFLRVIGALSIVPALALTICVARGFRAAGHSRIPAGAAGALAAVVTVAVGFVAHRTAFGAAVVRLLSF